MNIEDIRRLCTDETIIMTTHVLDRLRERGIKYNDIKESIMSGEIIEQYPDDYPHPSCLIFGVSVNHKYIHSVVGIADERLYIITAYYPSIYKWESDFKTRRREL